MLIEEIEKAHEILVHAFKYITQQSALGVNPVAEWRILSAAYRRLKQEPLYSLTSMALYGPRLETTHDPRVLRWVE